MATGGVSGIRSKVAQGLSLTVTPSGYTFQNNEGQGEAPILHPVLKGFLFAQVNTTPSSGLSWSVRQTNFVQAFFFFFLLLPSFKPQKTFEAKSLLSDSTVLLAQLQSGSGPAAEEETQGSLHFWSMAVR